MLLGKKKTEQKFADGISSSYRVWHDKLVQAVRLAMPPETPYTVIHVGDMIGVRRGCVLFLASFADAATSLDLTQLFSCIFVKNAESHALRDVAKITVKTGMGGRYGNKGAILSRFVIDDSSLCFINCHLVSISGGAAQPLALIPQIVFDVRQLGSLIGGSATTTSSKFSRTNLLLPDWGRVPQEPTLREATARRSLTTSYVYYRAISTIALMLGGRMYWPRSPKAHLTRCCRKTSSGKDSRRTRRLGCDLSKSRRLLLHRHTSTLMLCHSASSRSADDDSSR